MPKEKKAPALSSDQVAACPYCRPTADNLNESKLDVVKSVGEESSNNWEETKCPICLEAPHNAVLLVCSNSTKGCRPYMCKTSKLQSNCLDQFLKLGASKPMLLCPLCRGPVDEWNDVEPAQRELMNSMPRGCSSETCEFRGTYEELEKHACSTEHPSVQPSVADTVHQLRMLSLQRERDLQDIRTRDSERKLNNSFVSSSSGVIGQSRNRDFAPIVEIFNRRTAHNRDFASLVEVLNSSSSLSSSSGVIEQARNRDFASLVEVLNSSSSLSSSSGVIRQARNRDFASLVEVLNSSSSLSSSSRLIGQARNRDFASLVEVLNSSSVLTGRRIARR